jgi:sec-independent protein translocase protein TatC
MQDKPDVEQPFLSHLVELRDRLLRVVVVVLVMFVVVFPFQNQVYSYVAEPLMAHLPTGASMIATEVASPFLTPMKLAFVAAIFLSMPFILYQFWAFVAPGLYRHERKMVLPLVVSSTLLFYVGMAFAYYVVFPLVFKFLTGTAPEGVAVMTDIGRYLDFVLTLFFAFGLAFEVPIATIILVWMGVTTPEKLSAKRPYIIVGAFVIGMFLTPPDIISQTLLALPMWVLFELGVIFSRGFVRPEQEADEGRGEEDSGSPEQTGTAENEPASTAGETPDETGKAAASGPVKHADDFTPLSEEEMEAELARIEAEENLLEPENGAADAASASETANVANPKLRRAMELRYKGDVAGARTILYEILVDGDAGDIELARHLLSELDSA